MILHARPIGDDWHGELTPDHDRPYSRFGATWTATRDLLCREVAHLGADELVLQLAITERDCRNDGWIRSTAKPDHPGVIVSFDSRHGPLRYSTDTFTGNGHGGYLPGWQANVRAVALGLEALRQVDRYGIARGGEQYRGWNALPPATEMGSATAMTVDEARRLLATHLAGHEPTTETEVRMAYRAAAKTAHPDAGGDPAVFRRLTEARDLLIGTA